MTRDQAINRALDEYDAVTEAVSVGERVGKFPMDAFLSSLAASGYAVVPVEATESMCDAGAEAFYNPIEETEAVEDIKIMWRVMLATAQEDSECE